MSSGKRKGSVLENLTLLSYVGIAMVVPIIGGLYIGKYLDNRLDTQPIFLFIFIIMGVVTSFINLFKVTTKDIKKK